MSNCTLATAPRLGATASATSGSILAKVSSTLLRACNLVVSTGKTFAVPDLGILWVFIAFHV